MRIVGGTWRGKQLTVPDGKETRPTLDRVRETVFNILEHNPALERPGGGSPVRGAAVLDAFAGSGALGLEALSRGAMSAVFFETAKPAQSALRANLAALKVGGVGRLMTGSALKPPRAEAAADLVFLDPPYGQGLIEEGVRALATTGWIGSQTLIYCEYDGRETPSFPEPFEVLLRRKVGRAEVSFLAPS